MVTATTATHPICLKHHCPLCGKKFKKKRETEYHLRWSPRHTELTLKPKAATTTTEGAYPSDMVFVKAQTEGVILRYTCCLCWHLSENLNTLETHLIDHHVLSHEQQHQQQKPQHHRHFLQQQLLNDTDDDNDDNDNNDEQQQQQKPQHRRRRRLKQQFLNDTDDDYDNNNNNNNSDDDDDEEEEYIEEYIENDHASDSSYTPRGMRHLRRTAPKDDYSASSATRSRTKKRPRRSTRATLAEWNQDRRRKQQLNESRDDSTESEYDDNDTTNQQSSSSNKNNNNNININSSDSSEADVDQQDLLASPSSSSSSSSYRATKRPREIAVELNHDQHQRQQSPQDHDQQLNESRNGSDIEYDNDSNNTGEPFSTNSSYNDPLDAAADDDDDDDDNSHQPFSSSSYNEEDIHQQDFSALSSSATGAKTPPRMTVDAVTMGTMASLLHNHTNRLLDKVNMMEQQVLDWKNDMWTQNNELFYKIKALESRQEQQFTNLKMMLLKSNKDREEKHNQSQQTTEENKVDLMQYMETYMTQRTTNDQIDLTQHLETYVAQRIAEQVDPLKQRIIELEQQQLQQTDAEEYLTVD